MGNPAVFWRLDYLPLCSGLRCVNSGIIFADQEKGGQKNHKDLPGVRIRGRMVREGRGNRNFLIPHLGRKLSTLMSATSLPLFLVKLILRSPAFALDQTSGGAFLSHKICTQGSAPYSLAVASGVKSSW